MSQKKEKDNKSNTLYNFFTKDPNNNKRKKNTSKLEMLLSSNSDTNSNTNIDTNINTTDKKNRLNKKNLKFNLKWKDEFDWLRYEENNEGGKMFCTWGEIAKKTNRFTFGCDWLKHDALIQHSTTLDHKKSKPILNNQTIEYGFKSKHHYATHGLRDLENLSTQQFNEAKNEALFGPFVGLKNV
ncbi:5343_t:CDS:2 [Dentiscutata erythropus]|uniref:5343_t:CDS:1 n=1 Tax=Dentiscutata erythropus TaxID=1348616 RepID=A0A9N8Z005_9GLOM|nr:5343_t:CDS:2 [Dentiscutata erythropus]